jgi:hypothetical protein
LNVKTFKTCEASALSEGLTKVFFSFKFSTTTDCKKKSGKKQLKIVVTVKNAQSIFITCSRTLEIPSTFLTAQR